MQLRSLFFVVFIVVSSNSSLVQDNFKKLGLTVDDKCFNDKQIKVEGFDEQLEHCRGEFDEQILKFNVEQICEDPGSDLCASVIRTKSDACLEPADKEIVERRINVITAELKYACTNKEEFQNYFACARNKNVTEPTSECISTRERVEAENKNAFSDERCQLVIKLDSCEAERYKSCSDASVKFLNETTKSGLRQTPCAKFLSGGGPVNAMNVAAGIILGSIHLGLHFF